MNKKIISVVGILLVFILLIVVMNLQPREKLTDDVNEIMSNAKYESETVKEKELKDFIEITVDEYLNYYNEKDKKIVLIGRDTCTYCRIAIPILKYINYKYDLNIYYINTDHFTNDDNDKLINSHEIFQENFGTPLLLIIGNGKIIDKQDGLTDKLHYEKLLKDNKIIK